MDSPKRCERCSAPSGSRDRLTLSAVVTCYKDAQAIVQMHERLTSALSSLPVDYEIIFVNDGSPDDTDSVIEKLTARDGHVLAIEHSRNFGSQNAFTSGMQIAIGDAVVLLDGDLQDPPELIPAFFAEWRKGTDVVYGRRSKREGSAIQAWLARGFYRVFRRLSDTPMPLDAGDFALMDRRVVDVLLALPETDQFLRGLRAWVGFTQSGVDYLRPKRAFGRSTHSWMKNLWWAKKGVFSFSFMPVEMIGYTAAVSTAISGVGLAYQVFSAVLGEAAPNGVAMLSFVVAFFGSLNLLALAVLGEYLIKVLEETKRRPKFIRKAVRCGHEHITTAEGIDAFSRERRALSERRRTTRRAMAGEQ